MTKAEAKPVRKFMFKAILKVLGWGTLAILLFTFSFSLLGSSDEEPSQSSQTQEPSTPDEASTPPSEDSLDSADNSGSPGGENMSLSQAFCADLESGLSIFQIFRSIQDYSDETIEEFADTAYGFAAISCPDELATNSGLRGFLESWDINPDA